MVVGGSRQQPGLANANRNGAALCVDDSFLRHERPCRRNRHTESQSVKPHNNQFSLNFVQRFSPEAYLPAGVIGRLAHCPACAKSVVFQNVALDCRTEQTLHRLAPAREYPRGLVAVTYRASRSPPVLTTPKRFFRPEVLRNPSGWRALALARTVASMPAWRGETAAAPIPSPMMRILSLE
jgi:hypothetical protein